MSASVNANHDKGPKILAVQWSLTSVTVVVVAARMYIRVFLVRNAGLDDFIILASLVRRWTFLHPFQTHNLLCTGLDSCVCWDDNGKCGNGIWKARMVTGGEHSGKN
jgi:hypothetical protein